MASIADLTASVQALQDNLNAALSDLSAKVSALEAQVDPTLLDPLKSSIDAMASQVKAADPGPAAPPPPAPAAPTETVFTFAGDPASVDAAVWPKATVETPEGQALYTFSGPTLPDPLPDGWAPYTGPTQPVPGAPAG